MKKLLFVFNPNSGKGQIKNSLLEILKIFSGADYEVTVYPTKKSNDGYEKVKSVGNNYDLIVCSGGDGTLNEAVRGVRELETKVPIGYIPSGTTNDFASSLKISKTMSRAAQDIVNGKVFNCDIGIMNDKRTFNYVAAFGAFTEVSYATPQNIKNLLGHQAYVLEAAKSLVALKAYKTKIECDELNIEGDYIFGMIVNSYSVGGIKGITGKNVKLDDGKFEVFMVKDIKNIIDVQQLLTAAVTHDYKKCDMMHYFKTNHIKITTEEGVDWTLDGEFGGKNKSTVIDVLKQELQIIVPQ